MKINLREEFFNEKEFIIAENKSLRATAFRYSTGVAALKIENAKGYFIILPFMGQQLWRAHFDGRDLGMKTTFAEPVPNVSFLQTYGGFLYHCGISSVGAPDESHLQHGEIPNIKYQTAYLTVDEDENGAYMAVGGTVDYNIAFTRRYAFSPCCALYEDATVMKIDVNLTNLREVPMEYAYLCHINFAPIDGAKLYYNSHLKTVHRGVPADMAEEKKAKLIAHMDNLEKDIHVADIVGKEGQFYEPEICCTMLYDDEVGRTMQYVEGEGACYVEHDVKALPCSIRWISRTGNEDAMGMVLPSTCEHLGYKYIKEQDQIKYLDPHATLSFSITVGWIDDTKAKEIKKILGE